MRPYLLLGTAWMCIASYSAQISDSEDAHSKTSNWTSSALVTRDYEPNAEEDESGRQERLEVRLMGGTDDDHTIRYRYFSTTSDSYVTTNEGADPEADDKRHDNNLPGHYATQYQRDRDSLNDTIYTITAVNDYDPKIDVHATGGNPQTSNDKSEIIKLNASFPNDQLDAEKFLERYKTNDRNSSDYKEIEMSDLEKIIQNLEDVEIFKGSEKINLNETSSLNSIRQILDFTKDSNGIPKNISFLFDGKNFTDEISEESNFVFSTYPENRSLIESYSRDGLEPASSEEIVQKMGDTIHQEPRDGIKRELQDGDDEIEGKLQYEMQREAQYATKRKLQDGIKRTLQNGIESALQNEIERKTQFGIEQELQDEMEQSQDGTESRSSYDSDFLFGNNSESESAKGTSALINATISEETKTKYSVLFDNLSNSTKPDDETYVDLPDNRNSQIEPQVIESGGVYSTNVEIVKSFPRLEYHPEKVNKDLKEILPIIRSVKSEMAESNEFYSPPAIRANVNSPQKHINPVNVAPLLDVTTDSRDETNAVSSDGIKENTDSGERVNIGKPDEISTRSRDGIKNGPRVNTYSRENENLNSEADNEIKTRSIISKNETADDNSNSNLQTIEQDFPLNFENGQNLIFNYVPARYPPAENNFFDVLPVSFVAQPDQHFPEKQMIRYVLPTQILENQKDTNLMIPATDILNNVQIVQSVNYNDLSPKENQILSVNNSVKNEEQINANDENLNNNFQRERANLHSEYVIKGIPNFPSKNADETRVQVPPQSSKEGNYNASASDIMAQNHQILPYQNLGQYIPAFQNQNSEAANRVPPVANLKQEYPEQRQRDLETVNFYQPFQNFKQNNRNNVPQSFRSVSPNYQPQILEPNNPNLLRVDSSFPFKFVQLENPYFPGPNAAQWRHNQSKIPLESTPNLPSNIQNISQDQSKLLNNFNGDAHSLIPPLIFLPPPTPPPIMLPMLYPTYHYIPLHAIRNPPTPQQPYYRNFEPQNVLENQQQIENSNPSKSSEPLNRNNKLSIVLLPPYRYQQIAPQKRRPYNTRPHHTTSESKPQQYWAPPPAQSKYSRDEFSKYYRKKATKENYSIKKSEKYLSREPVKPAKGGAPFKPSQPLWDSVYPPSHMYYVPFYVDLGASEASYSNDASHANRRNRRMSRLIMEYGGFKPPFVPSTLLSVNDEPVISKNAL